MADDAAEKQVPTLEPGRVTLEQERLFLRALLDNLPLSIYFKDRDSRFVLVSKDLARKFRASTSEIVGLDDAAEFGPVHAREAREDELAVMNTGVPILNKEEREDNPDGSFTWAKTSKFPLYDEQGNLLGTFGVSSDITKRVIAEERLERERNLLRTLIDMLPFRIFVKDADGRYLLSNTIHRETLGVEDDSELLGKTILDFRPDEGGRRSDRRDRLVIETAEPLYDKEQPDLLNPGQDRWVTSSRMPIIGNGGEVEGLVGVSIDITSRKHAEIDLLEREQRMREELDVARKLQEALLPECLEVDGARRVLRTQPFEVAFHFQPCEQLAGDFFHLIRIDDHRLGILVADVMGHGVRAALVTSMIAGMVRRLEPMADQPGRFMTELNRGVSSMVKNTRSFLFATAVYAVVDAGRRQVHACNAGHCIPLCVAPGFFHPLELHNGPALVLNPDHEYVDCVSSSSSDCRLFFFTDGIIEAAGPSGTDWSQERFSDTLVSTRDLGLCEQVAATIADVKTFTGRDEFEDDICVVGVGAAPRAS